MVDLIVFPETLFYMPLFIPLLLGGFFYPILMNLYKTFVIHEPLKGNNLLNAGTAVVHLVLGGGIMVFISILYYLLALLYWFLLTELELNPIENLLNLILYFFFGVCATVYSALMYFRLKQSLRRTTAP